MRNRPPAAFSHHSAGHRTARVRFAASLDAALVDGPFEHPVGYSDTNSAHGLIVAYRANDELFVSLQGWLTDPLSDAFDDTCFPDQVGSKVGP